MEADDDDDELTPEEVAEQERLEKEEAAQKTRKGKQRDQRNINPVDDEVADLLGPVPFL